MAATSLCVHTKKCENKITKTRFASQIPVKSYLKRVYTTCNIESGFLHTHFKSHSLLYLPCGITLGTGNGAQGGVSQLPGVSPISRSFQTRGIQSQQQQPHLYIVGFTGKVHTVRNKIVRKNRWRGFYSPRSATTETSK